MQKPNSSLCFEAYKNGDSIPRSYMTGFKPIVETY